VETVEEKRIEMEKEIEEIERRIDEQEREIEKKKKHAKMSNFGDDREEEMIKF
jgi:hypothetical protein